MVLIVDANRCGDFSVPMSFHAPIILINIAKRRIRIAVSDATLKELENTGLRKFLLEWFRSSIVFRVDEKKFNKYHAELLKYDLKSNDIAVLATARASASKLIYTDDRALIEDFTDRKILPNRGKVIMSTTNEQIVLELITRFGG